MPTTQQEHPDFGPLAQHSEHHIGDVITYTATEGSGTSTGAILWVQPPGEVAGRRRPLRYIVETETGGFPEIVASSDVLAAASNSPR